MENGLYKVEFETPRGAGAGVVFLENDKIRGGDSVMYYTGSVSQRGDDITAEVESRLHTPAVNSQLIFGLNHTHISLRGKGNGKLANFTGTAREAPGVPFKARLTKISD